MNASLWWDSGTLRQLALSASALHSRLTPMVHVIWLLFVLVLLALTWTSPTPNYSRAAFVVLPCLLLLQGLLLAIAFCDCARCNITLSPRRATSLVAGVAGMGCIAITLATGLIAAAPSDHHAPAAMALAVCSGALTCGCALGTALLAPGLRLHAMFFSLASAAGVYWAATEKNP